MDDFKKYRLIIIITGVVLAIVLTIFGLIRLWQAYQVGNLTVNSQQDNVAYTITGNENTYTGVTTLYYLNKGDYTIHAYGLIPGDLLPADYKVHVSGKKTTTINVNLSIDPSGFNQGGVEGP